MKHTHELLYPRMTNGCGETPGPGGTERVNLPCDTMNMRARDRDRVCRNYFVKLGTI
jgi:hypothetical protein